MRTVQKDVEEILSNPARLISDYHHVPVYIMQHHYNSGDLLNIIVQFKLKLFIWYNVDHLSADRTRSSNRDRSRRSPLLARLNQLIIAKTCFLSYTSILVFLHKLAFYATESARWACFNYFVLLYCS